MLTPLAALLLTGSAAANTATPPPSNDLCANAVPVVGGGSYAGTTVGMTFDNVGLCGTSNTAAGVWYVLAGDDSNYTVDTCTAASYDTKISVFSGSCGSLTCVDGNDDTCGLRSSVAFCASSGFNYYILVHGFGSQTGTFTLDVTNNGACPPNDNCLGALPAMIGYTHSGTTLGASPDGAPFCGTSNTGPGVWYTFTGNGNVIDVTTCNPDTNYDTKLSVFSGSCGGLVCEGGNDDDFTCPHGGLNSTVTVCSVPGVQYYILVHGFGIATGNFDMTLLDQGPSSNDDVCNALPVTLGSIPFNNICATAQAGEVTPGPGTVGPAPPCDATDGWCNFETDVQSSLWFTYTHECGGVQIDAGPGDYQLAVWTTTDCTDFSAFTEVAANDDGGPGFAPQLSLCGLIPGQTYYIQVDGFGVFAAAGTLTLTPIACIDCNSNGVDDECDIANGTSFDCNCNGVPDECDLLNPAMDVNNDGFIDSCVLCAGDTNCDGVINYLDMINVWANIGTSGPLGDVNYDGTVNFLDYFIVAWNYGSVCN